MNRFSIAAFGLFCLASAPATAATITQIAELPENLQIAPIDMGDWSLLDGLGTGVTVVNDKDRPQRLSAPVYGRSAIWGADYVNNNDAKVMEYRPNTVVPDIWLRITDAFDQRGQTAFIITAGDAKLTLDQPRTNGNELFLAISDFEGVLNIDTTADYDGYGINVLTEVAPVPLPAGMALILSGLGAFAWAGYRRKATPA